MSCSLLRQTKPHQGEQRYWKRSCVVVEGEARPRIEVVFAEAVPFAQIVREKGNQLNPALCEIAAVEALDAFCAASQVATALAR